jgi:YidC/Oxa1 family membrane protein insertase
MFQYTINFLVLDLMLPLLILCHQFIGNWGLSIVFLTLAIKSALMPFAFQGIKAQMEMQRVQPKLKEIQQKYKDKPEIMNKKMVEFYKENRVNPLGGCLPILIQMPFFIALYSTFLSGALEAEAGHNSAFLFIQDLTRIGIYHTDKVTHALTAIYYDNILLVLLFGISTFISQKMMMTNPDDPMQKQMLYMMPIMITFMFTFIPVPSGCLLYLVVSNMFTIGQNVIVLKKKKALKESMELSDSKSASIEGGSKKSINLDKNNISLIKNEQEELSPVLASAGKSKRAKKKQKKNRKK